MITQHKESKFLTCGKACPLVTFGKFNVEVCDKSLDIVVPFALKMEWGTKLKIAFLHCVNVNLLQK